MVVGLAGLFFPSVETVPLFQKFEQRSQNQTPLASLGHVLMLEPGLATLEPCRLSGSKMIPYRNSRVLLGSLQTVPIGFHTEPKEGLWGR